MIRSVCSFSCQSAGLQGTSVGDGDSSRTTTVSQTGDKNGLD